MRSQRPPKVGKYGGHGPPAVEKSTSGWVVASGILASRTSTTTSTRRSCSLRDFSALAIWPGYHCRQKRHDKKMHTTQILPYTICRDSENLAAAAVFNTEDKLTRGFLPEQVLQIVSGKQYLIPSQSTLALHPRTPLQLPHVLSAQYEPNPN